MNRRRFLIAAAGGALGLAFFTRPDSRGGGGHSAYFEKLSESLREQGLGRPTMLLDLDRLDRNVDELVREIGSRGYRVVAKSLPSPRLLEYVMGRANTARLMSFHQPFLNSTAVTSPKADILVGKPMPVAAADRFYGHLKVGAFDPARQLQWLVDSPERLRQYRELAAGRDIRLRVSVEIDVGLHRGGLQDPATLAEMLTAIGSDPRIELAGLMGYDPHVVKVPGLPGAQSREFARVQARYQGFLDVIRARSGEGAVRDLVLNAAGSPTYRLWSDVDGIANDLAAGSGLVKPLDFDIPTLFDLEPALFIATPVLKASSGLQVPGLGVMNHVWKGWDPNRSRTFFVYGGYWKAHPVSPPGLSENPLFGRSTNQEMLNGSSDVELDVDDFAFLRPTQSEFVMLQFGDLALVRSGQIVDFWPVFEQTA